MEKLKWGIDIDGVITANPPALSWLTYHLHKNENNNQIYILSWRNGSDLVRRRETKEDLKAFNIHYDFLIMAPQKFIDARTAALWKIDKIKELEIDIWMDNEIKQLQRDHGFNLDEMLPNVQKVWI